jgi:hypothetical protein
VLADSETRFKMRETVNKFNHLGILLLCFACAGLPQLPKLAEAANIVCDSMSEFEHFSVGVESVKQSLERQDYKAAHEQAKSLWTEYQNHPETEGMEELRSLIALLETLNRA